MKRIEFIPKPSKLLFVLLFLLHGLAVLAVFYSHIPVIVKVMLLLLLLISGYYQCWLGAWRRDKRSIIKCCYVDDQWFIWDKRHNQYEAKLLGDSIVSPYLLILNFSIKFRRRSLVLFPDALDKEAFRKIRVLLS